MDHRSIILDGRVAVRRLVINIGMDAKGQVIGQTHVATERKKLFVVSGRYAVIEVTKVDNTVSVAEAPLGPFGWEYDLL